MELSATLSNLVKRAFGQPAAPSDPLLGQLLIFSLTLSLLSLVVHLCINRPALKGLISWEPSLPKGLARFWGQEREPQITAQDFLTTFPPSPRHDILSSNTASALVLQCYLSSHSPTTLALQTSQLPSTSKQDMNRDDQFTPTGFSTAEIRALGAFPDYSILSGVPHPKPLPEFDVKSAVFRPFRPFRWAYHQTMSLSKLEPDYWIELEQNYFNMLKQRKNLLREHGTSVLNYGPGSELACRELMEMVLQYLCIRYPRCFSLTNSNTVFQNHLLGTTTDLTSTHPLHVLFDNVPEDFAIMLRNETDGMYYLKAGFICSSIGWTFGTHFNRQLRAIHTEVNDYEEKMAKSMDRYFAKLPTNKPIQRGAWFVEDWKPLFVTPDEYKANRGTRHQGEHVTIDQCYLRVDWQTLRRLPLSGSIVFNFKAIFTPMTELRDEPYIPSLMYKQITEGRPHLTESKVHEHIRKTVLDSLQEWKGEQIKSGVIEPDWEETTLPESPFYPGWEKRWQRKLGFSI